VDESSRRDALRATEIDASIGRQVTSCWAQGSGSAVGAWHWAAVSMATVAALSLVAVTLKRKAGTAAASLERPGPPGDYSAPLLGRIRAMNAPAGGLVLELELVVDSPRDRIFSALTDSAELARWWGPAGYTMAEIDLDLRVGGGYRFTMQPPGGDPFHLAGEFLEIEPPRRVVYTFHYEEPDPDDSETVVALSLEEVGDATHVSLSQGEFATEARLALHRSGWRDSLEKLCELTESSA
jgi:uncharacterized protein YndB with AHSA1/START domain